MAFVFVRTSRQPRDPSERPDIYCRQNSRGYRCGSRSARRAARGGEDGILYDYKRRIQGHASVSRAPSRHRHRRGVRIMSAPEHSPLPWTYETHELSTGFSSIVYCANGYGVPGLSHLNEPDARLIITAVNSHAANAALLAAAK